MSGVPHIYGAAAFSPERKFKTLEEAQDVLNVLEHNKITHLDTAQLYGQSEATLGKLNAGARFTIDTKAAGGAIADALQHVVLVQRARESLNRLRVTKVNCSFRDNHD
jgi:aflatoxin B1 aldehyde reductase